MKANEFVKKVGWDLAKELADECPSYCNYLHENGFYQISEAWQLNEKHVLVSDLKRLVESYDYVQIHGYEQSKEIVDDAPSDNVYYSWLLGTSGVKDKTVHIGTLRKAIADVEACNEKPQ